MLNFMFIISLIYFKCTGEYAIMGVEEGELVHHITVGNVKSILP